MQVVCIVCVHAQITRDGLNSVTNIRVGSKATAERCLIQLHLSWLPLRRSVCGVVLRVLRYATTKGKFG